MHHITGNPNKYAHLLTYRQHQFHHIVDLYYQNYDKIAKLHQVITLAMILIGVLLLVYLLLEKYFR